MFCLCDIKCLKSEDNNSFIHRGRPQMFSPDVIKIVHTKNQLAKTLILKYLYVYFKDVCERQSRWAETLAHFPQKQHMTSSFLSFRRTRKLSLLIAFQQPSRWSCTTSLKNYNITWRSNTDVSIGWGEVWVSVYVNADIEITNHVIRFHFILLVFGDPESWSTKWPIDTLFGYNRSMNYYRSNYATPR